MNAVTDQALEAKYKRAMDMMEQDEAAAAALLEEAAEEGHREAACSLARCYHHGTGVAQDLKTAYQLYLRAALQGSGKGLTMVGDFYAQGLGVRQSWREAIKWYLDATVSEDSEAVGYAEYRLAEILAEGHGVEQDLQGAAEWYAKALSHGELRAREALERLGLEAAVHVRQAEPADAAAIWQLSVMELGCRCSLEALQERLCALLGKDALFAATEDGRVVGYVHARDLDTLTEPHRKQVLALACSGREDIRQALLARLRSWAGNTEITNL